MVKQSNRPSWSQKILTDEQIQKISNRVHEMETYTQGEIVPILVRRSTHVGHVPFLILGFLSISTFAIERTWLAVSWGLWPTWVYFPLFVIYWVISQYLGQLHWLQRWLTTDSDEVSQVLQRAQLEFHQSDVHQTRHKTGILIFVSLMERRAVVLADRTISEKVDEKTWDGVTQALTHEFKEKRYFEGLDKAISLSGELLKTHLPAEAANPNEIGNHLIIKD